MAPTWSDLGQLVRPAEVTTGSSPGGFVGQRSGTPAWGWFSPGLTTGPLQSSLGRLVIPPRPVSILCPQLASPRQTHPSLVRELTGR